MLGAQTAAVSVFLTVRIRETIDAFRAIVCNRAADDPPVLERV